MAATSGRVFVVQEPFRKEGNAVVPRINLGTLEAFGEIVYLCSWGELRHDGTSDMEPDRIADLLHKMRAKLATFCDTDYLVCLGNPALCAMAAILAAECNEGRVAILDWIRNDEHYRIWDIDVQCQPVIAPGALARSRDGR